MMPQDFANQTNMFLLLPTPWEVELLSIENDNNLRRDGAIWNHYLKFLYLS
jgi:hypothetical protein